ncbi:MAG: hypothetical protein R3A12_01370 [Ignavibacteria bacterium]
MTLFNTSEAVASGARFICCSLIPSCIFAEFFCSLRRDSSFARVCDDSTTISSVLSPSTVSDTFIFAVFPFVTTMSLNVLGV